MDTYRQLIKSALAKRNWTTFHFFSFFEHYCSSVLPRFPVPKRCIHHLSHNNNNLFSHIGKKGVGGVKIANRPSVQWVCAYMPSKDKHTLMCPTACVCCGSSTGLRDRYTHTCRLSSPFGAVSELVCARRGERLQSGCREQKLGTVIVSVHACLLTSISDHKRLVQ